MDKLKKYRKIILDYFEEYSKIKYVNLDAENIIIADKERDRYELVTVGWEKYNRIHSSVMHLDIIDGKIWVQNDNTERGVVNVLEEQGVPKSDIVIGYFVPIMREYAGYAVS